MGWPPTGRDSKQDTNIEEFSEMAAFLQRYDQLVESGNKFILYLMAGPASPTSGRTWCPDCDMALPTIKNELLDKNPKYKILQATISDPVSWIGQSKHPLKSHNTIRATSVPSLFLCQGD